MVDKRWTLSTKSLNEHNIVHYCVHYHIMFMKGGDTMEILPISALRDTNMISEICTQQKEPIFITKNGAGHLVIMEHGEYMKMKEEMRLYKSAVDSIKRYKTSGEELQDFDDFMGEIEKEYGIHTEGDKGSKR